MANKTVSGFGDTSINGTYVENGTRNGYTFYEKDDTCFLIYIPNFSPASARTASITAGGAYYLIKIFNLRGAIAQELRQYKVNGTNPTASGWISLRSWRTGEEQVGTVQNV